MRLVVREYRRLQGWAEANLAVNSNPKCRKTIPLTYGILEATGQLLSQDSWRLVGAEDKDEDKEGARPFSFFV
jgi:hypothetical protein